MSDETYLCIRCLGTFPHSKATLEQQAQGLRILCGPCECIVELKERVEELEATIRQHCRMVHLHVPSGNWDAYNQIHVPESENILYKPLGGYVAIRTAEEEKQQCTH